MKDERLINISDYYGRDSITEFRMGITNAHIADVVRVDEGEAAISGGRSILSKEFITCNAILAVNLETPSVPLFHLKSSDFKIQGGGKKLETYNEFLSESGDKFAINIRNKKGFDATRVCNEMKADGIKFLEPIILDNEGMWHMIYRPESRQLFIIDKEHDKILTYMPFQEIEKLFKAKTNIDLHKIDPALSQSTNIEF